MVDLTSNVYGVVVWVPVGPVAAPRHPRSRSPTLLDTRERRWRFDRTPSRSPSKTNRILMGLNQSSDPIEQVWTTGPWSQHVGNHILQSISDTCALLTCPSAAEGGLQHLSHIVAAVRTPLGGVVVLNTLRIRAPRTSPGKSSMEQLCRMW